MPLLRLNGVSKRFEGLLAVDGVSLDLHPGETLGIVGPNGSGKTTLFNLISGVHTPDGGVITLAGQNITEAPAYQRAYLGIARTFQIPRPFGSITVRENVAIGAMFGARDRRLSIDEALETADHFLGLLGFHAQREKPARELTPVEKKRMEIARALAMKPKVLLLDECMAGMPPKEVDAMVGFLQKVQAEEGIAMVAMVEHIMRAVLGFASRVVVLYQGKKLLEAPPAQALSDPRVIDVYLGRQ